MFDQEKKHSGAWLFERSDVVVFVDFSYFLLLFLLVVNFISYFLQAKGVRFVTFFTTCNFHKLLFTGPRGPGLILYSLCDGGKGAP